MPRIKYKDKDAYAKMHKTMCIDQYDWNNMHKPKCMEHYAFKKMH